MENIDYILILLSYLIGSLSSAIIVCKLMRLPDPRGEGSGNPGATNVLRFGGKKAAAITLAGDMLKGLLPVLLAKYLDITVLGIALVGLASFLGHLYPIFFQFKGGKGGRDHARGDVWIFLVDWSGYRRYLVIYGKNCQNFIASCSRGNRTCSDLCLVLV